MLTKVTVYIPSHKYGCYLKQAIESVLAQSMESWELIIICDGVVDDTEKIAGEYLNLHPEKIRVIVNEKSLGLQACANMALRQARGEYIIRLDADDYFDENALLVLSQYLDKHKDVALVYPNYIYVSESGQFLGIENRKRVGFEAKLLDLPAHGACTLIRKRILKTVGGYSEEHCLQDGYDLWLKILNRYPVGNVMTPLFFYRQHAKSQSHNEEKILEARGRIKRQHVKSVGGPVKLSVVAVLGAKNTYPHLPDIVLRPVADKPLIRHTLDVVSASRIFDRVLVTTDDQKVCDYCGTFDDILTLLRPKELSGERVLTSEIANNAVQYLEQSEGCYPDIIVYLNIHAPFRCEKQIQKAIDTLILYNTDKVFSVYEDFELHYRHAKNGLNPLYKMRHEQLRIEREALYVNNGAIFVTWRDILTNIETDDIKIGHIVMTRDESFQIKKEEDIWLVDKLLRRRQDKKLEKNTLGA